MKYLLSIFFCFFNIAALFSTEKTRLPENNYNLNLQIEAQQNNLEFIKKVDKQKQKEAIIKQFFQKHNMNSLVNTIEKERENYNEIIEHFVLAGDKLADEPTNENCKTLIELVKRRSTQFEHELTLRNFQLRPANLYHLLLNHENGYKNKPRSVKELQDFMNIKTEIASDVKAIENTLEEIENPSKNKILADNAETVIGYAMSLEKIEESRKESKSTIKTLGLTHDGNENAEFLKRILTIAENLGLDTDLILFKITSGNKSMLVSIKPDLAVTGESSKLLFKCFIDQSISSWSDDVIAALLSHEYTHLEDGLIVNSPDILKKQNDLHTICSHIQETKADLGFIINNQHISLAKKIELAEAMHAFFCQRKYELSIDGVKRNPLYPSIHKRARNFKHGVRVLLNEPGAFAAAPKTWFSMKLFGLLPSEKHFAYLAAKTPVGASLITATVLTAGYCVVTTCKKWYQAYKEKRKKRSVKIDAVPNHPAPAAKNSNL